MCVLRHTQIPSGRGEANSILPEQLGDTLRYWSVVRDAKNSGSLPSRKSATFVVVKSLAMTESTRIPLAVLVGPARLYFFELWMFPVLAENVHPSGGLGK